MVSQSGAYPKQALQVARRSTGKSEALDGETVSKKKPEVGIIHAWEVRRDGTAVDYFEDSKTCTWYIYDFKEGTYQKKVLEKIE